MDARLEVLVVGVDEGLVLKLEDVLEGEGCNTAVAQDGQAALAICREKIFDLAFIETKLPEISGAELIDKLAQVSPETEYVIITGHAPPVSAIGALEHRNSVAYQTKFLHMDYLATFTKQIIGRKRMEEELKQYQAMVESAHDAIFFKDLKSRYIIANEKTLESFGLSHEEVIGKNDYELMRDKEQARKNVEDDQVVFKTRKAKETIKHMAGAEGKEYWFQAIKVPHFDIGGSVTGLVGVARDITERKRMEEENKELEAQFQQSQKLEAIGRLAGGIAHDFNNLLMGIEGRTSLILMDADSSHPHFEHLKGIEDYVKEAAELTKQLLGFARCGKYETKPTDLNDLIKSQNRLFGRTKKEIAIHGKYEKNLWVAEVDRGQMGQVLLNFYVNAWQAMPAGGNLYIQTENVTLDEDCSELYGVEPGRYVKISVTDTGVGMDEATLQRVFDPFFTTKERGRGVGLGLASVYGIIKNHGGFVNVYSEMGKGSTFSIYLPASEKEVIAGEESSQDVLKGCETILLIDDEDMIICVGQQMLGSLGYNVLPARGGEEAIEIYKKNKDKIDMVILDMVMPGMGGGETYDRLKEINPDTKALLSSGYSINGQAKEILERGCDGFLQKPFSMKELSKRIREILDKPGTKKDPFPQRFSAY